MARILMLSPVSPWPATTGGLVRIYEIARGLSRYHDVVFVAPKDTAASSLDIPTQTILVDSTARTRWGQLRALLSSRPYHVVLHDEPLMARRVASLITDNSFDLIYVHFLYPLIYIPPSVRIPVIVDQQNVDREYWKRRMRAPAASLPMRILTWINWRKIVRFETQMLKRITAYVSVSELDRQKTMVYASGHVQHFLVAPNGVDLQRFQPRSVYNRNRKVTLGFVGSFDVHLNRDAAQVLCRQILPTVKKRLQEHGYDVALLLVGRNPPTQIRELANLDSSIRVTGTVESMPPYLQQMDLLVLPLREGAGTKLRTLEAMATGLPVIGTSLAFEGIHDIEDGVHARVVSDIDSLPDAVVELACQPELRLRLGTEARRLVERCYNWEAITARLAGELASLRATRFLTDVGL